MKKIVTVDLDGTLLNGNNEIIGGEETTRLISILQDLNVEFVINTGRLDHDIVSISQRYGLPDVTRISQNGAVIINGENLSAQLLDRQEALLFWSYVQNIPLRVELNTISNRYWLTDRPKDFVRELYPSEQFVTSFDGVIEHQPIVLFLVIGEGEQVTALRSYVEEQFDHIYPVQTSANSLEILPCGVSKGASLRALYPNNKIYGIGDSENDHTVFQVADKGYYIGNTHEDAVKVESVTEALQLILDDIKAEEDKR